jgi:hypothetical protein
LARLIRRAAEEADRWGVMGRAGRLKVETYHDANRVVTALEDLYEKAAVTAK